MTLLSATNFDTTPNENATKFRRKWRLKNPLRTKENIDYISYMLLCQKINKNITCIPSISRNLLFYFKNVANLYSAIIFPNKLPTFHVILCNSRIGNRVSISFH